MAILSTEDFDASNVAVETAVLESAAALRSAYEDIDRDVDTDLRLFFPVQELDIDQTTDQLTLTAETTECEVIRGIDFITIVR